MIEPQLYDTIELLIDLPKHSLPVGARGAIVHIHTDDLYEIEFATDKGQTTALCVLPVTEFIIVWRAETEEWIPIVDQIAQIVARLPVDSRAEVRDFAHFLTIKQHSRLPVVV
jgi:hypothetical protein